MSTIRGRYRNGHIDLDCPLDLQEDEHVYVTIVRERPTGVMTPEEIRTIIMSFDSLYPPDGWGATDPKAWGKLWMRTAAEAATEILRRKAGQEKVELTEH